MDRGKRDFIKLSALAASALAADWLLPAGGLRVGGGGAVAAERGLRGSGLPQAVSFEECQSLDHHAMVER
ncbi:MAG: hypothetical protein LIP77_03200, partial [Planctomycetes bacterium]|nr:hypothetical protein [Planctomycetota bacterium]